MVGIGAPNWSKTVQKNDIVGHDCYSPRNASIGLRRDDLYAGQMPEISPVITATAMVSPSVEN